MSVVVNGTNVNIIMVNGSNVQTIYVNGIQVWPDAIASEFYYTLTANDLTKTIYFTQSAANAVLIDWGDNTPSNSSSDTSATLSHTYASPGDYVLKVYCESGQTWSPGATISGTVYSWEYTTASVYNETLKKVVCKDGMNLTKNKAFYNFKGMEEFIFRENMLFTAGAALFGCEALTSIIIPDGVTSIPGTAFSSCVNLSQFVIGKDVSTIGISVLAGCTSVFSVTSLATTPPTLSNSLSQFVTTAYVPASSVSAYQNANRWSSYTILPIT